MLAKPSKTKKKTVKTPLPVGLKQCAGCGTSLHLEIHHVIYGNGMRNTSSEEGLVCWLCYECHRSYKGVHGGNIDLDNRLKAKYQRIWIENKLSEGYILEQAKNEWYSKFYKYYEE